MVAYANDLMAGVIVAASAFAGLTVVMFAYIVNSKSLVRIGKVSFICGILVVVFAILWFYFGQIWWVSVIAVVLLIVQMYAAWTALEKFLISRQTKR
jgi:hypothetical protein